MSEYARRIRAARAYAGFTQDDLAERLGVDPQTIKRRESGDQDPKLGERIAIAAICDVPAEFMELGFGTITPDEIAQRLERIEAALADGLDDKRQALLDLTSGAAPEAPASEDEQRTSPEEDDPPSRAEGL